MKEKNKIKRNSEKIDLGFNFKSNETGSKKIKFWDDVI